MARLLLLLATAWAEELNLALSADDCGDQCVLSALQVRGEANSEALDAPLEAPLEDEFDRYEAWDAGLRPISSAVSCDL